MHRWLAWYRDQGLDSLADPVASSGYPSGPHPAGGIQVGITHAGLTVSVTSTDRTFRVHAGNELLEVTRSASKPIARFKARKPEPPRATAR